MIRKLFVKNKNNLIKNNIQSLTKLFHGNFSNPNKTKIKNKNFDLIFQLLIIKSLNVKTFLPE